MSEPLYEHYTDTEGLTTGVCPFCQSECVPLVVVKPKVDQRQGYRGRWRHILQCQGCRATRIAIEGGKDNTPYWVNEKAP